MLPVPSRCIGKGERRANLRAGCRAAYCYLRKREPTVWDDVADLIISPKRSYNIKLFLAATALFFFRPLSRVTFASLREIRRVSFSCSIVVGGCSIGFPAFNVVGNRSGTTFQASIKLIHITFPGVIVGAVLSMIPWFLCDSVVSSYPLSTRAFMAQKM